jgi:hypothetical protein
MWPKHTVNPEQVLLLDKMAAAVKMQKSQSGQLASAGGSGK